MKLIMVLMLTAIPLYCYAGSGCQRLEDIISKAIDSNVTVAQFQDFVKEFVHSSATNNAVGKFKQCFLNQNNATLENVKVMMQSIYNSKFCKPF